MPKCPKCGKLIDRVSVAEKKLYTYEVAICDESSHLYYEDEGEVSSEDFKASCPECGEDLGLNNEDAILKFLRGGEGNVD